MANQPQKKNIPFNHVLAALLNSQNVFPPTYLHHFSDLEGKDLEALRQAWPQVSANRRFTILEDLEDLAESDTLVAFENVARMALNDTDARVRTVAIRLLWEDEDARLVPVFLRMLNEDSEVQVRAAAATALGLFVYNGELEELPEETLRQVCDALLDVINSPDDKLVRRRALESMGYSSRKEVPELLRQAYQTNDPEWLASALFAMGRSADEVWAPDVMRMLRHPRVNVQLEAVRAAGNLEMHGSRRVLLDLLDEEAQDADVRAAVIWSLSQIGGEEVREKLEELLEETEEDDSDEAELLENALDNLSFTEDTGLYTMYNFESLGQNAENEENEDIDGYLDALEKLEEDESGSEADSSSDDSSGEKSSGSKRPRQQ